MAPGTQAPGTGGPAVPPPFDPELAVALAAINEMFPPTFTIQMLPGLRAALTESFTISTAAA